MLDIVLGIIGAVVGGWLFAAFGGTGITGFNLYSMFVAVIGAVVVLVVYMLWSGAERSERPNSRMEQSSREGGGDYGREQSAAQFSRRLERCRARQVTS